MVDMQEAPVGWPGLVNEEACPGRLVWVPVERDDSLPDWTQSINLTEGAHLDEPPEHGQVLGSFRPGDYRNLYHFAHDRGWWVQDVETGQALGGKLRCNRNAAFWQLAFCCFLGVFITFLAGSLVLSIISQLIHMAGMMDPMKGAGIGGVAIALPCIGLVLWRLWRLLPGALVEPVEILQSGMVELPRTNRWLGLVKALGIFSGLIAVLSLPSAFAAAILVGQVKVLVLACCQSAVLVLLAWRCFALSRGKELAWSQVELNGSIGKAVDLGIRIAIFSLGGQLLGGSIALSGLASNSLTGSLSLLPGLMTSFTGFGALLAVITAKYTGSTRAILVLGVGANLVGVVYLGPWFDAAVTLWAVAIPGLISAMGASKEKRVEVLTQAFRASWSFTLGGVVGRILGRFFGLFFLGLGGSAVGQALGEQILSCVCLLSQKLPQSEKPERLAYDSQISS